MTYHNEHCDAGGECAQCDEEAVLSELHENVRETLMDHIRTREERAREYREGARALDSDVAMIKEAARTERWYLLKGYLPAATIESLCNVSPADLLVDEHGDPL